MSDSLRYPAQVFFSDEDEGFVAIAPDLPGCSAFGETQEEALAELQHAIAAWIGAAKKAGNPIPSPSSRPADELPSGKVLLRLPKTLHAQLIARADLDSSSLNTCIVMLLSHALAEKEAGADMLAPHAQSNMATIAVLGGLTDLHALWMTHHVHGDAAAAVVTQTVSRSTSGVGENQRLINGGSVLNLLALPAGQPVLRLDD